MSPDETGKFLGLLASLLAIFGWLFRNSMEMGQLRFQVKELWRVTFANAQVELVNRGLAKSESPIHIIPEGYEFFRPYINDFMPIYQRVKQRSNGLDDAEFERRLFQAFSTEKSDFIIKAIALPNKLSLGASIMAVIQACQLTDQGGMSPVS